MLRYLRCVLLVLVVLMCASVRAQAAPEPSSERVEVQGDSSKIERFIIHYRVNEIQLDADYMDNRTQLHKIRHYFENSPRIDSVTIYSWASPEGGITLNKYLSKERGKSAKKLLLGFSPDSSRFNSDKIKLSPIAENWAGLEKLVDERYFRHDRDKVLQIIRARGISDETRKWRLQQLNEGITWKYLIRNYMPELRAATWICVWAEVIDPMPEVAAKMEAAMKAEMTHQVDSVTLVYPVVTPEVMEQERPLLALKTNTLYDLALIPNIGVEYYLGNNFSIAGNWMYAWWKNDKVQWYWRTYGGDIGLRYWFGKAAEEKPLTGHHIGLYGQIITYDFAIGGSGYLGDRWTYAGGLEYGYSLPLGKRLNIDFNLGLGYLSGEFKEYVYLDGHYAWQATKRRHYVGPTKAEISLVWQFPFGEIKAGKGGIR